jgi:O-acetyl-ADP-ribose deacetylase (regulator of RNase III)
MSVPKIIFADPNIAVVDALDAAFAGIERVATHHGGFEDVSGFDCMVSPANSFGLMDGGVDAAITAFFGEQLQERVQRLIATEHFGEQPVGSCLLVETRHRQHPWLAHCPTMRVPMDIRGTDHVYSAFRAALGAVRRGNMIGAGIEVVVCPGLGTGCGRMEAVESARQVRAAFESHTGEPVGVSWNTAARRQSMVGVRPLNPSYAPGLTIEDWTEFEYAAYALAKAIGLAGGRPFHEYTDVLWNHRDPIREFLRELLEELVDLGTLESKDLPEGAVYRTSQ